MSTKQETQRFVRASKPLLRPKPKLDRAIASFENGMQQALHQAKYADQARLALEDRMQYMSESLNQRIDQLYDRVSDANHETRHRVAGSDLPPDVSEQINRLLARCHNVILDLEQKLSVANEEIDARDELLDQAMEILQAVSEEIEEVEQEDDLYDSQLLKATESLSAPLGASSTPITRNQKSKAKKPRKIAKRGKDGRINTKDAEDKIASMGEVIYATPVRFKPIQIVGRRVLPDPTSH